LNEPMQQGKLQSALQIAQVQRLVPQALQTF